MNIYKLVDATNGDTFFYLLTSAEKETVEKTVEFVQAYSHDGAYDPTQVIDTIKALGFNIERVDTIQASVIEF